MALLLGRGTVVGAFIGSERSPSYVAAGLGSSRILLDLVAHGAFVNSLTGFGNTPLHVACDIDEFENVKALIEHGAQISESSSMSGDQPLHAAVAKSSNFTLIQYLLDYEADSCCEDFEHRRLLHFAAFNNWVEVIHVLSDHGANLECLDIHWSTPLHYAVQNKAKFAIEYLLKQGVRSGSKCFDLLSGVI